MDQRRYLQVAVDTMNIFKAVEVTTDRYVKNVEMLATV